VPIDEIEAKWLLDALPLRWAPGRSTACLSLGSGLIDAAQRGLRSIEIAFP
jgi:hypothetical protein